MIIDGIGIKKIELKEIELELKEMQLEFNKRNYNELEWELEWIKWN